MKVGLIDVDSHNFPNLALMKISAWHKANGDDVEMCFPIKRYDRIYMSRVFDDTYSRDVDFQPMAEDIRRGGSGYDINSKLHECVEHMMPDYSLYGINDTAYGYLSRGCPRGCPFCIVSKKEGRASRKVADLSEFWNGQKYIKLLDPNITACADWRDLFWQLEESRAIVDFTQGLDIRLMTDEKCDALNRIKTSVIHFAWDGNEDLAPLFARFDKEIKKHRVNRRVYVLTNYSSDMDWNLYRIYKLRELNYEPYVMVYDKPNSPHEVKKLQRWCNDKFVFGKCRRFEEYDANARSERYNRK